MAAKRIYLVASKLPRVGEPMTERRLIRAPNAAQALGHAARSSLAVTVASQDDLIELVKAGVSVEDAGAQPEPT